MRFLHLSDLHIGKKLNGFSLIEDQRHILEQTLAIIDEHGLDAVIIAGDIYDSGFPPTEAVTLLDEFLTKILERNKPLFIISGNHDSPERLSFGNRIMTSRGLYIEGVFRGKPSCVTLTDSHGKINIHMLPFVKPAYVNAYYGRSYMTYDEAVRFVTAKAKILTRERNILIAHQFVTASSTAPELSDSEMKYVGGLDNVDYAAFDGFDYVALGHLHSPQTSGRDTVVYSGSPLKYSVSERFQRKCAVVADIREKGDVEILKIPFVPLRDLRQIKGHLDELIKAPKSDDYISVVLTDTERRLEPFKRLRAVYKNCISVEYEYERESDDVSDGTAAAGELLDTPIETFKRFYFERNNENMNDESVRYIEKILNMIVDGDSL